MARKKVKPTAVAASEQSKRERGPIVCERDSEEAKRIESTHGFSAAAEARKKGAAAANEGRQPASAVDSEKGDT